MPSVYEVSYKERQMSVALRKACLEAIEEGETDEICAKLGFKWPALQRLVAEQDWDLRIAVRSAECLGLPVVTDLVMAAQAGVL